MAVSRDSLQPWGKWDSKSGILRLSGSPCGVRMWGSVALVPSIAGLVTPSMPEARSHALSQWAAL